MNKLQETLGDEACDKKGSLHASTRLPSNSSDVKKKQALENSAASSFREPKRSWNPLKRNPPPVPQQRDTSGETRAGWLSRLTFQWMTPIMVTGYKRPLELNDLWTVNPARASRLLAGKLERSFTMRLDRGDKRPLLFALYDTCKYDFLLGGSCQLISSVIQTISPFLMRFLISFAQKAYYAKKRGETAPHVGRGIGIVIAILVLQVMSSFATNHFIYRGLMVGGQSRAVLMTVIFDKALRISGRAKAGGKEIPSPPAGIKPGSPEEKKWYQRLLRREIKGGNSPKLMAGAVMGDGQGWSNGRIINLMSVDTYRVDQAAGFFHVIWCAPIQVLITLILLIINLSYSALAGFALLVIAMPILAKAVQVLLKRRAAINKLTDQRVSITQEILQSVRFVKFFAWEHSFLDHIFSVRRREIFSLQKLLAIRNAANAVSMSMPVFASMITFIVFSASHPNLSPALIFSSLALFNGLRLPLSFLPLVLGQVVDAASSLRRIQEFLLAEEANEDFEWDLNSKHAIILENAGFTWERNTTQEAHPIKSKKPAKAWEKLSKEDKVQQKAARKTMKTEQISAESSGTSPVVTGKATQLELELYKLNDICFTAAHDELVAVIGSVGSGKSSLLAALAGDMRKTDGRVLFGATRSFCPQYAWIQNTSCRENVVFGQEFRQDWYDKVIDACALVPDFDMLPHGDQTEIGELGITLSGGQKQRLNIARAVYFDADIVLLDDPLSAVDAHVGRHIMDNVICGLLKDKCRILVTHQLHVLHRTDRIVWMKDGYIKKVDTFTNLLATDEDFQRLLATTSMELDQEKDKVVASNDKDEQTKKNVKVNQRGAALMTSEERAVEAVSWKVYMAYIKISGGYWVAPLVFLILVCTQCSNIATNLWLSWWTSNQFGLSKGVYIAVYTVLGFSQVFLMFLFSLSLSVFGTQASKHMVRESMKRVLRAPMSFFDTTPLGRITNRFSRDVDTMDNTLTDAMRMYFMTLAMIIGILALVIVYFHYFAIVIAPLFAFFCFSAAYYRASAREIKRHEAIERSHVFSRFSEAVSGVATVRAYGLQDRFKDSIRDSIDGMNGIYFLTFANQRWLSMRLDIVGNLLIFTVGILVVTSRFSVRPSIGGLVLSYILSIVQMIQFSVRQLADVENSMISTERLHYYATQLEQEAPLKLGLVPANWPDKGKIDFNNVQMCYRPGLPLVLKGFDLHIAAGERIGVVGRTGAGKSSIMSSLFRMVEVSGGNITIDGIDISTIGLHDLRTKLSIIPQDPTLFRGTIRSNLDPFGEYSDLKLWHALRAADLVETETLQTLGPTENGDSMKNTERQDKLHLDTNVEEEGLNFSLGQRQMMTLARALVRDSRIIICDEATSSVDFEMDQKIQNTILTAFQGKTLLCIAHRLKTILSYDRIVVMDQGRIAEVESPLRLYDQGGIFTGMCDRSGIMRDEIASFARETS